MKIQKIVGLVIALALVVGGAVYFRAQGKPSVGVINVFTWSNYYPEALVEEFTKNTGIEVRFTLLSSNEELFAKLKAGAGGFDVIQPSDYMIRQMRRADMLAPIDHDLLPNLKHLDNYYSSLPYDPALKYSVPFTWGTTGIAVDTRKVKVPEGEMSWRFLLDSPDFRHTSILNDAREAFAAFLFWENFPMNKVTPAVFDRVKGRIENLKTKILTFNSEPKQLLLRGEVSIAHIFSCDGIQAQEANSAIRYFIPKEGATIWIDNFAIPVSAPNPKLAHVFINYFLDPDVNYRQIRENHLATPNRSAKERLPIEISGNPHLYPPPEVRARLQFLEELNDSLPYINRLWTDLKS